MFKAVKYAICSAIVTCGVTAAAAGDLPAQIFDDAMRACRADYHDFCSYVLPGEGRAGRCLLDHERELTPACLKAVKFAYAVEVCLPDYRRYCSGVAPGGGHIVQCLSERLGALQPECERIVRANLPYMNADGGPYGDYRGRQSYDDGRFANNGRRYYDDYVGDEGRYAEDKRYLDGEHHVSPEDRYADRGRYFDDRDGDRRHSEDYDEREPVK